MDLSSKENFNVKISKLLREKYICDFIWNNVNITIYSEKYKKQRPSKDLQFTLGIPTYVKEGNFGYDYLNSKKGWFIGNIIIYSEYFPDFEVVELKNILNEIKSKILNLKIYNKFGDLLIAHTIEDLIEKLVSRTTEIINNLIPYFEKKFNKDLRNEIFIKFKDYKNECILNKLREIDCPNQEIFNLEI